MGRAAGILYKTLERYETVILNPCSSFTLGAQTADYVNVSGLSSPISGDLTYTVNTTISKYVIQVTEGTVTRDKLYYVVTVTVTWPPVNTTGISESLTVTRQELNRYPLSPRCTDVVI
jgi:hypothetical protein